MTAVFKIQLINPSGKVPDFTGDGYNIYAAEDTEIKENVPTTIPTGFKMAFDKNFCALITRYKLKTLAGLIDSDYRGEVKIIVISTKPVLVKQGEIIAKMQLLEIECPEIQAQQEYPSDANIEVK